VRPQLQAVDDESGAIRSVIQPQSGNDDSREICSIIQSLKCQSLALIFRESKIPTQSKSAEADNREAEMVTAEKSADIIQSVSAKALYRYFAKAKYQRSAKALKPTTAKRAASCPDVDRASGALHNEKQQRCQMMESCLAA
jgi:hypothetical protein